MDFHRTGTDSEATPNFLVGSTFGNLRENFALTRRQAALARKVYRQPKISGCTSVALRERRDGAAHARDDRASSKWLDEIVEAPLFTASTAELTSPSPVTMKIGAG
jgi:hypothetical protein